MELEVSWRRDTDVGALLSNMGSRAKGPKGSAVTSLAKRASPDWGPVVTARLADAIRRCMVVGGSSGARRVGREAWFGFLSRCLHPSCPIGQLQLGAQRR